MGDINVNALKKLDEAEKNFARVVELEPNNVQAHHNLCVVHVERGDLIRAEKCLTKVHNMAPTEQYIINHLNIVRTKLNELIKKRQEELKKQKAGQQGANWSVSSGLRVYVFWLMIAWWNWLFIDENMSNKSEMSSTLVIQNIYSFIPWKLRNENKKIILGQAWLSDSYFFLMWFA